ncbi:hypothetical protein C8Q76DRAFT_694176 [Earliella scabrosa]|nr:hypothetical protein C8Q76DRAFT_694176 [Earliella scabrosa]
MPERTGRPQRQWQLLLQPSLTCVGGDSHYSLVASNPVRQKLPASDPSPLVRGHKRKHLSGLVPEGPVTAPQSLSKEDEKGKGRGPTHARTERMSACARDVQSPSPNSNTPVRRRALLKPHRASTFNAKLEEEGTDIAQVVSAEECWGVAPATGLAWLQKSRLLPRNPCKTLPSTFDSEPREVLLGRADSVDDLVK